MKPVAPGDGVRHGAQSWYKDDWPFPAYITAPTCQGTYSLSP